VVSIDFLRSTCKLLKWRVLLKIAEGIWVSMVWFPSVVSEHRILGLVKCLK